MNKLYIIFNIIVSANAFAEVIACDDAATDYYAAYDAHEHTCSAGYFLPANTDGCRQCPPGYTCNGGTFEFNPDNYQGAILDTVTTTTMNNVCADNFPTDLYAIYDPKTVTITFDDGTGNTTAKTCTYDGLVNIPETPPTRTGYIFNGWKLENK